MAQGGGVAPLLHSILDRLESRGQSGIAAIPPSVKAQLAQSYYSNAAYNAVLCRELAGVLAALTEAGVPVILLKGAALIKTIYADPADRPMNDLDLLVRRADIPRAVSALQARGFQRLMDNYIRFHVFLLGGQAGQVSVELHWSLVLNDQRFPALIDWFWGQSEPLKATSSLASVLSPTAQLLYLTAHLGLQHKGEERLIWFYDLSLLAARRCEDIDWDGLLQQAVQAGWADALYQAFSMVQDRFGLIDGTLPLPEGWLERLQQQADLQPAQPGLTVGILKTWKESSVRDRLGLLRGALFPRPAYLRWRYHPRPEWLWPLWYLRRWWDILLDMGNVAV